MINILNDYGKLSGGKHQFNDIGKVSKLFKPKDIDLLYPKIIINKKYYTSKYFKDNKAYFKFINNKKNNIDVIMVTYTKNNKIKLVYSKIKEV